MEDLEPVQPLPTEGEEPAQVDAATRKRWAEFRQRVQTTKNYKKKIISNWQTNIDFRRGKSFNAQDDNDSIAVNLDWSYTKTKQAALFSQVPKVRIAHHPESVAAGPWLATYERKLNDTLVKAGVEAALDEVLPDVINAAGFGVVLVAFEAITKDKEVPAIDLKMLPPDLLEEFKATGMVFGEPMPMKIVPDRLDARYTIRRISPADFLWPTDFTGSDFDNASWLGHTGRLTWAEAQLRFKLTDEDKQALQTEERTYLDRLTDDIDKETAYHDDKVGYDEIFYHDHLFNSSATSFSTIHHLVFLHGKTEPVLDEPWKGQQIGPNGKVIGALKNPLRVLTLTYLSDEDIPPSDSAVGRSQVIEINKGRTIANKQRAHNAPWTWFDVNRLDPSIQSALMRGEWKYAVPVQGDGSRIIGTVDQPQLPQENYKFDEIAKLDLQEVWTIGSNQQGIGGGVETKGEANIIQNNFQTKVGRERAKVAAFFVGIAEVLGGLLTIFEDIQQFGEGFNADINEKLEYSILADSTVLVDSRQRLQDLNDYVDRYAKTGWVNIEPVLKEISTLIGLDPNATVRPPQPQQPPMPTISLRLTGGEDMMNPLLLAFMLKTGQAPEPQLIEKAKELIQSTTMMPQGPPPQSGVPPTPPTPMGEAMPDAGLLPSLGKRASDVPERGA